MKKIEIRDDDDILFGCTLIPELLNHCKKITKEMRRMVKQQTKSFWIRFATSFRTYFLRNEISMLYYEKSEEEKVIQEQAFINILKMLTENNKFSEFYPLAESIGKYHDAIVKLQGRKSILEASAIAHAVSRFEHPIGTYLIYSRFTSSMVILYERWKHAPQKTQRGPTVKWNPPSHWKDSKKELEMYEQFLWGQWGRKLYSMLDLNRQDICLFEKNLHPNSASGGGSTSESFKARAFRDNFPNSSKTKKGRKRKGTQPSKFFPKSELPSISGASEPEFKETSMELEVSSEYSLQINATAAKKDPNKKVGRSNFGDNIGNFSMTEEACGHDGRKTDIEECLMETDEYIDHYHHHQFVTGSKMETEEYDIQGSKDMKKGANKNTDYGITSDMAPRKNVKRENNSHNVSAKNSKPSETSGSTGGNIKFFDYSKLFDTKVQSCEENRSEQPKSSNTFFNYGNIFQFGEHKNKTKESNDTTKHFNSRSTSRKIASTVTKNRKTASSATRKTENNEYSINPSAKDTAKTVINHEHGNYYDDECAMDLRKNINSENKRSTHSVSIGNTHGFASSSQTSRDTASKNSKYFDQSKLFNYNINAQSTETKAKEQQQMSRDFNDCDIYFSSEHKRTIATPETKNINSKSTSSVNRQMEAVEDNDFPSMAKNMSYYGHQEPYSHVYGAKSYSEMSALDLRKNLNKESTDSDSFGNSESHGFVTPSDTTTSRATTSGNSKSLDHSKHFHFNEENFNESKKTNDFFNYGNLFQFGQKGSISKRKDHIDKTESSSTTHEIKSHVHNDEYSKPVNNTYGTTSEKHKDKHNATYMRKHANVENISHNASIRKRKPHGFKSPPHTVTSENSKGSTDTFFDYKKLFEFNTEETAQTDETKMRGNNTLEADMETDTLLTTEAIDLSTKANSCDNVSNCSANTCGKTEVGPSNAEQKTPKMTKVNENKETNSEKSDSFMYDRLFKFETSEHTEEAGNNNADHRGFNGHTNGPYGFDRFNNSNGFDGFNPHGYNPYNQHGFQRFDPLNIYEFFRQEFGGYVPHGFGRYQHGFGTHAHGNFGFPEHPFFQSFEEMHSFYRRFRDGDVKNVRKYLLQKCSNCNILEKTTESFEECSECIKSCGLIRVPPMYCGKFCRIAHWKREHMMFHFGNIMDDS